MRPLRGGADRQTPAACIDHQGRCHLTVLAKQQPRQIASLFQKLSNLSRPHLSLAPLDVKDDAPLDPIHLSFLSSDTVVLATNPLTEVI